MFDTWTCPTCNKKRPAPMLECHKCGANKPGTENQPKKRDKKLAPTEENSLSPLEQIQKLAAEAQAAKIIAEAAAKKAEKAAKAVEDIVKEITKVK